MQQPTKLVSVGNYKLKGSNLGKGTFARVELAAHVILKKEVALKIIQISAIKDPYMRKNLHREANIISRLSHQNIVRLIEICKSTDIYCLVLEYVSGGTMFEHVQNRKSLSESEARKWSRQLISAVAYLHKERILHRDLKLENILLDKNRDRLILIDFGLSNFWHPGKHMNTHCGSAEYAAPELFMKDAPYGSGVDTWSFGIILYTMTMGHLPFQIEASMAGEGALSVLIKKVMKGLVHVHHREMNALSIDCRVLIMRCLDTNPSTRISVKAICSDPWLGCAALGSRKLITSQLPIVDEAVIAADIKQRLNIKLSVKDILEHVGRRKFGTTAGCFNLIKQDYLKKTLDCPPNPANKHNLQQLEADTAPSEDREQHPPTATCTDQSMFDILDTPTQTPVPVEEEDKKAPPQSDNLKKSESCKNDAFSEAKVDDGQSRRSRSQDSRAPPSWRRSFLNIPSSGKLSFSRLKRVDSDKEDHDSSKADSGIFRMIGQKALEDITNSVRPLLRRHSKREASDTKFDTLPKSGRPVAADAVEVKNPMLPQDSLTKKLRSRAMLGSTPRKPQRF